MTILQIDSSITGENSVSRQLTHATVEQLRKAGPGARVVHRDLAANPLGHFTLDGSSDDGALDEFLDADTIVVGAPMYNFTVPTQLKAWIDRIAVNGRTFRYTADGPQGLAKGKRVIVVVSRGGFYAADNAFEHVESYLKAVFNFIGIEPEFVRADGVNIGPEQRDASIAAARDEVMALAA